MKNIFIYLTLMFLLFIGCNKKKANIITYHLKRTDFVEKIEASGTIQAVNNITIVAPRVNVQSMTIAHLADEGSHVKKGDTICILDAPELVNIVESFTTELETMEASMKKLEADNAMEMSLLKAQVATNKAQVAISMLDSVQMKFAPPVKQRLLELELEKANIEKKKLQKKLAAQMRINNSEISQLRSRIMMQKGRVQMYQNQINLLTIVAPRDGIIVHTEMPLMMFMSITGLGTIGGKMEERSSIWSNMPLLQLPDVSQMQVSVEVPEADYKRIKTGQKVFIRVDAVKDLFTTGIIKRKNLAGKTTQRESALKTYEVIASIDSCHSRMNPGLSAWCEIVIDEVKDTVVVPAAAVFGKDSSRIVYVASDEKFRKVGIETGLSNSTECIVSRGLKGNEIIALVEPPYNMIFKEKKVERAITDTVSRTRPDSLKLKKIKN